MKEYIEFLEAKHRATREAYLKEGKSYRSRDVAHENGYIHALHDILDAIDLPEKNRQLEETMKHFGERLKG